jgi:light-regulated signal transduction histidine kinase (bacteriophytochrome)
VALFDSELRYLVADGAGLSWLDLPPEPMAGSTLQEIFPARVRAVIEPELRAALQGESRQFDMPFAGRTQQIRVVPVSKDDGQAPGCMVLAQDVTAQRQAETAIGRAMERLEQRVAEHTEDLQRSNAEVEAFSNSVSHELRGPLGAVTGFVRILGDQYGAMLPAEAREYLELIHESAARMSLAIGHLLAFSRLQRQALERIEVDPADLVRQVWEELATERAGRRAELRLGALPSCQADPRLLAQLLVNLIGNALKFTRQRAAALIEVGACDHDGVTAYYVRDNGVGFDMRYAHKLFKLFERLHDVKDYEGSGVGLAMVKRIVSRHGGHIWAKSDQGRETTFYFTLEKATGGDSGGIAELAGEGPPNPAGT